MDVDQRIERMIQENKEVKGLSFEAKRYLETENYSEALRQLKRANEISTCSYCKQKLQEAIYEIQYNKKICRIDSKNCEPSKSHIIQHIDDFVGGLHNVEEIRTKKIRGDEADSGGKYQAEEGIDIFKTIGFNPVESVATTVNMVSRSVGSMIDSLLKGFK